MITAQIISILAFLLSWLWWVTLIFGLISLGFLQLVWCCRQGKIGLFVSVGISTLAGITCTIAGIVMIVHTFILAMYFYLLFMFTRTDF